MTDLESPFPVYEDPGRDSLTLRQHHFQDTALDMHTLVGSLEAGKGNASQELLQGLLNRRIGASIIRLRSFDGRLLTNWTIGTILYISLLLRWGWLGPAQFSNGWCSETNVFEGVDLINY